MHSFFYRKNELYCEQTSVKELAERHGTPLYVYSQETVARHFQDLDAALQPLDHQICYAVKANSNLAVLRLLARLGSGFDIVSAGELRRVIAAGGDPARCVFAGVGKTEGEIEFALRRGIYCFNASIRILTPIPTPKSPPAPTRTNSAFSSNKSKASMPARAGSRTCAGAARRCTLARN
jgi:diaminopimelate decarboxylase